MIQPLTTKKQALHLVKEVLALQKPKGRVPYQVRFDKSSWRDIELPIQSLQTLAEEAGSSPTKTRTFEALPVLHTLNLIHHGATKDQDTAMIDIADEEYQVESFEDDVLKISYSFMVRYTDKASTDRALKAAAKKKSTQNMWAPRIVSGQFTIMPGN